MSNDEKEAYLKDFGARVKRYRLARQLTLEELATKCGYTSATSRSTMQKIEAGKSDIPASKIVILAKALDVTISDLIDGCEHENVNQLGKLVVERFGKPVAKLIPLIAKLDDEDLAEIRGEVKGMLRAEKYTQAEAPTMDAVG